ncbi:Tify domain binding domain [Dillenia turbinata]|uniref:Tify domain binding domain n=1 Tax=Dillenia turbinata TaxID=194707 RepID=A0AAN8ZQE5_9MAGN
MEEEEACVPELINGQIVDCEKSENHSRMELKREFQLVVDSNDTEICPSKKQAKESSNNEDSRSEVSNPDPSLGDNASILQKISFPSPESAKVNEVGCGEVTSTCSDDSSTDSLSDEEYREKDSSPVVSASHVVLEASKNGSSSGIRKITFKFSNRTKPQFDEAMSNSVAVSNGVCSQSYCEEHGLNASMSHDFSLETHSTMWSERFSEASDLAEVPSRRKWTISKDLVPNNVKKLLSTGILEGARVKYMAQNQEKELRGIIRDSGYLCGCSRCNYSRVLSAYEFEQHAGARTRHPNNHIYLENGKPVYSVIQELKTCHLNLLEEVIKDVAGSAVNEENLHSWKVNLERSDKIVDADNGNWNMFHSLSFSHVSCQGQPREDSLCRSLYSMAPSVSLKMKTHMQRVKAFKPSAKKLAFSLYLFFLSFLVDCHLKRSYFSNSSMRPRKTTEGGPRKRQGDNDLHRLLFMQKGLPDGAELAYYVKGQRVLSGCKMGSGILCACCNTEISPSQFEAHAGWSTRRQPYRHIYASNGLTLHDIAISLANGQNLTSGDSDDMCAVCGDGGNLILCSGCPQAFHQECLELPSVPNGGWICPYCKDKGSLSNASSGENSNVERPMVIRLRRDVKEPEPEVGGCVVCRAQDFSILEFDDRTVILCDQCEKEYHISCLRESGLCDLKELPKDKWFCSVDCKNIHVTLQNFVVNGAYAIIPCVLNTIVRKHKDKGLALDGADDTRWQILRGKSRRPEDMPLLSRTCAIFRECFHPIKTQNHRDLIPLMVYGRNICGQEFWGMHCVVLTINSIVVSTGLLRIFDREVAELPLVATCKKHQGKGYFQALFSCIEGLLHSLNVKKIVLPAAEEAKSIWTNKFCFREMTEEEFRGCNRTYQFTVFKGTSMLVKEVPLISD